MKLTSLIPVAAAALIAAMPAAAQAPATAQQKVAAAKPVKAKKENFKALAKISKDSARTIALARVAAGSKVKSSKLEREKGTVVYSFDIRVPKESGVEEILVSALDGSVVSQEHESPKQEKAEAAKDKAAKKKG